jgi:hypothetical protein
MDTAANTPVLRELGLFSYIVERNSRCRIAYSKRNERRVMALQSNSIGVSRSRKRANTMTVSAKTNTRKAEAMQPGVAWQQALMRYLPGWIILAMVLSILLPNILSATFGVAGRTVSGSTTIVGTIINGGVISSAPRIAPLFTEEVQHWSDDISRWAAQYGLDPNLLATVMQIESCGHSSISSVAGAQGLFQVMPFHFDFGEVQTDPDTNAKRSANFLNECLAWAGGDAGLALACYNGGPSMTTRPFSNWPDETQRYYRWGTGIYQDASANMSESQTLNSWLEAGGQYLCNQAAATQSAR